VSDLVREVGKVEALDGLRIVVGLDGGTVTLGPSRYTEPIWHLTQDQAEEFARLFVSAVWQAGEAGHRHG